MQASSGLKDHQVVVVGGGRWARVLIDVLSQAAPPGASIAVLSRCNADGMARWVTARRFGHPIAVSDSWPEEASKHRCAIVANAAGDHESAIEAALLQGYHVLAEKPICLTLAASSRLAALARSRNLLLASAHVFLFASYLERFARVVGQGGVPESILIVWEDAEAESRYGERKSIDSSLPIVADLVPHVVSILGLLRPGGDLVVDGIDVEGGGARVVLRLYSGGVPTRVQMTRKGSERRRRIMVMAGGDCSSLDFSREPGVIATVAGTVSGDEQWSRQPRPLHRMLQAFLAAASGGETDPRLDVGRGLLANAIIDQALVPYREVQLNLVRRQLSEAGTPLNDELRYALVELLQYRRRLSLDVLDRLMDRLRGRLLGPDRQQRLQRLADASSAEAICRLAGGDDV